MHNVIEKAAPSPGVAAKTFTVSSTAVDLGSAQAFAAVEVRFVLVEVQGDDVRVRYDGTDPTASVGHLLLAGTREVWAVSRWNRARVIRARSSDATLFASPLTF